MELFASQQQHIMQLYCWKHLNNAFRFFWKAMGLACANPPFSLLAKVLTKIAYEGGRVVMCTLDRGCSGEHGYWHRTLDRMTVGRVQLPNGPIYVPENSDTAMQAPEWASFLSIFDGSLHPVPLCDLDQVLLKEVMAENRGHYRKDCTGVKHRSKNLIPDFHEDPENQVLLFGAAPLVFSREFDIHPCSHEGLGHPGQSPLLGVIPLRGGVIPLWGLLGVTFGRRRSSSGR